MTLEELESIRSAGLTRQYQLTLHADDERMEDGLTVQDIDEALSNCEIVEEYPEDKRGQSCLLLGHTASKQPIHLVCAPKADQRVIIITVYIPSMPKWKNPRERNR